MPQVVRPLLLYDGDCRFCRASARFVARLDGAQRLAFLPMRDERAEPYVLLVPDSVRFKSFHVIESDDRTSSRGAGVITVLSILRSTSVLGRALRALYATWLMDLLYAGVARSRGFLGRFVRDAPGPVRWP